jgi:hypothetical protein
MAIKEQRFGVGVDENEEQGGADHCGGLDRIEKGHRLCSKLNLRLAQIQIQIQPQHTIRKSYRNRFINETRSFSQNFEQLFHGAPRFFPVAAFV